MSDLAMFSDWNEALSAVVTHLGGSKKVGTMLRPEWKDRPEAASQWLRDCLNPAKAERFNPEQVFLLLKLARESNYHAAKHWFDAELGYEQGKPLDAQNEAAKLQRQVVEASRILKDSLDRLERLTNSPLAVVTGKAA